MRVSIPNSPLQRQLHEWASSRNVLLWPQMWPMSDVRGDVRSATTTVQPDGGAIITGCALPDWLSVDAAGPDVYNQRITSIKSGGRKLLEGACTYADIGAAQTSTSNGTLLAPIAVMPGDRFELGIDSTNGQPFGGVGGGAVAIAPTALGYQLLTAAGAVMTDAQARRLFADLVAQLGELHIVAMSAILSSSLRYVDSTSPSVPMTIEYIATGNLLAPLGADVAAADLRLGNLRLLPLGYDAPTTGGAIPFSSVLPLGGLRVSPNTQIKVDITFGSVVSGARSVALFGRSR
jgi:hypothetical protein